MRIADRSRQVQRFDRRHGPPYGQDIPVTTIAGRRLEFEYASGAGQGADIVLLHEGLGSVAMWREFPREVAHATGARVLSYSRAGYGRSEPLSEPRTVDYMHEEARTVLPELLDHFAIERPILLGHSDGASIALLYAAEAAARCPGVIVMAPHVVVEDVSIRSIETARRAWHETDLRDRLSRYHDDVESAFWDWNDVWLSAEFRGWNIEDAVSRIHCPVLGIQGRDDEYGTLAQLDRIEVRVPRFERVVLERCGHSPHRDRLDAVLPPVARFVGGLGVTNRSAPGGARSSGTPGS